MDTDNKITSDKNKPESTINSSWSSNPLSGAGKIARMNAITPSRAISNRLYAGYNNYSQKPVFSVDYSELISLLNEVLKNKTEADELFYSLHNIFTNRLNTHFTAFGYCNRQSKCVNLKLIDKIGSTYSTKIFESDSSNPVVEAVESNEVIFKESTKFLNIPYLSDSRCIIIPMKFQSNSIGVFVVGDNELETNQSLYEMMSVYLSMFIQNKELSEQVSLNSNEDTLTGLYNHRTFQEYLSKEINKADKVSQELSILIFDVNNISTINKELGHSKGDEIIKLVASKIKQNIRANDIAGRYGGDEIAVILPDTNTDDAKYLAEYLTYSLSCCLVDDVGPVKVSVGIATYPNSAVEQEKLLILAEQAMYISKSKGYQNGISTIVSSQDFDFWDDMALSSFASVLTKRHASIGVNFEEELVNKFTNEEIINQNHLIDVVTSLATAIDAKDEYTKDHSTSVSRYSEALARALNLPEKEVERIKLGAMLHDVGKIGIPENVLRKPTKLSDDEWAIMKQHPTIGAEKVLLPNKALHDLIPMVKHHHEHWDGTGYPDRLKGEEIPYTARIVSIADAFHALVSDRPYRKGLGVEKACEILRLGAGIQWEKEMVRVFIQIAPSLVTKI